MAATAGGCGASSAPSRAEFAKRADFTCAVANRSAPQSTPRTAKQAARYTQAQIVGRSALDAKLRKLSVAKGERGDFDAFNADTAQLIGVLRQQNAAARAKDENRDAKLQDR